MVTKKDTRIAAHLAVFAPAAVYLIYLFFTTSVNSYFESIQASGYHIFLLLFAVTLSKIYLHKKNRIFWKSDFLLMLAIFVLFGSLKIVHPSELYLPVLALTGTVYSATGIILWWYNPYNFK